MRQNQEERSGVPEQETDGNFETDFRNAEALLALGADLAQDETHNEETAQNNPEEETVPTEYVLSPLEHKICSKLAEFKVLRITSISRDLLAICVGYTCTSSKAFANAFRKLKDNGYIGVHQQSSHVKFLDRGWNEMEHCNLNVPRSNEEVHSTIRILLCKIASEKKSMPKMGEIFDILCDGQLHDRQDVAEAVGYKCLASKGFTGPIATMKELGLIETNSTRCLKLSTKLCFPYGTDSRRDILSSIQLQEAV